MADQRFSPLTRSFTEIEDHVHEAESFILLKHDFGAFFIAGTLATHNLEGPLFPNGSPFTPFDQEAGWDLIRSKAWRTRQLQSYNLVLCFAKDFERIAAYRRFRGHPIRTVEAELEEAKRITFEEKCIRTLEHLEWLAQKDEILEIPYGTRVKDRQDFAFISNPSVKENGMTYGCQGVQASLVYSWLYDQRLIVCRPETTGGNLVLGPGAYIELDKLKRAQTVIQSAFFVRRYDETRDSFFDALSDAVEKEVGCTIDPVWRYQHNEKIDDLILRRIRESPVIIVEIDNTNFNVGFEAGFAMSMSKPMVAIKRVDRPPNGDRSQLRIQNPFDIATFNTYAYWDAEDSKEQAKNLADLIQTVSERVRIGLAHADLMAGRR